MLVFFFHPHTPNGCINHGKTKDSSSSAQVDATSAKKSHAPKACARLYIRFHPPQIQGQLVILQPESRVDVQRGPEQWLEVVRVIYFEAGRQAKRVSCKSNIVKISLQQN